MKYQWLEEEKTCQQLSQELGCPVKRMTKGGIIVGYQDGEPITRKGVEIELEKETPEILARLDTILSAGEGSLKREGGKTPADELADLKKRVEEIENKLAEAGK